MSEERVMKQPMLAAAAQAPPPAAAADSAGGGPAGVAAVGAVGGGGDWALLARAAATPLLGGLTVGLTIGNIPGVIQSAPSFDSALHPADADRETIGSMMQAGAILGALFAGWACDRFGRRASIAIAAALLVVGAVVCVSASDSSDGTAAATGATQPCTRAADCVPLVGAGHSRFCSYYAKDTCVGGSTCAGQCDLCSACWADSDALGGSCTAECGAPSPPPPSRGGRIFALIAGRFLAGMGMGAASHSVPVFTSELAEASVRGALG